MKELIKKDISLNWKYIFFAVLFIFLPMSFAVLYMESLEPYTIFMVHVLMATSILVFINLGGEDQNNINTLYLSLPIKRMDIIKAKYVTYGIASLVLSILFYITLVVIDRPDNLGDIRVGLDIIIVGTSFTLVILAIILPVIFKWRKVAPIISIIMFVIYALINIKTLSLMPNFLFNSFGWPVLLAISLVVYLISLKVNLSLE